MITGLNHNIKQGGILFHIQTEDSGVRWGHVISHLFIGGTILATERTSYKDKVDLPADELEKHVREAIRQSHKAMIHKLVTGGYDDLAAKYKPNQAEQGEDVAAPSAEASAQDAAARSAGPDDAEAEILEVDVDDIDPRTINLFTLLGVTQRRKIEPVNLRETVMRLLGESIDPKAGTRPNTNF